MPYIHRTKWGRSIEITGGYGLHWSLNTVPSDYDIGRVTLPSWADLDYGVIKGAYIDMVIPSFTNTGGGNNWILADAGYPKLTCLPLGHSAFDLISDLTLACYSRANGTYPYTRIYGDTNFASIFTTGSSHYYNHVCEIDLDNVRSQLDNLILENAYFIQRFYVR